MNTVNVIGNLVREPRLIQSESGKDILVFTLAVDDRIERSDKSHDKRTDFIPIALFDSQARHFSTILRKGSRVGVSGKLRSRTFLTQEDERKEVIEVHPTHVDLLTSRANVEQQ